MSYAIFLTGIFAYFTYRIVKQNYSETEKKSLAIKELESKYLILAKQNIEKIQEYKMEIPHYDQIEKKESNENLEGH